MKYLMKLESFWKREKKEKVDPSEWTKEEKDLLSSKYGMIPLDGEYKFHGKTMNIKVKKQFDSIDGLYKTYSNTYYLVSISYEPARNKVLQNAAQGIDYKELGVTDFSFLSPKVESVDTLSELDNLLQIYIK